MSLPEAREIRCSRRKARPATGMLGRLIGASLALAALSGCGSSGFQPMYAASPTGSDLSKTMAQVSVTTIPGRVGQRIRNELTFQATGGGDPAPAKYSLDITIKERLTSTLVNFEGDSRSQIYSITARFQLTDLESKEVLVSGSSLARAGFERFDSVYSNVRAKEDAENRAARTVAHDIKSRLEAYLAHR